MSFWKKLFGGGDAAKPSAAPSVEAQEEHEGFLIKATPMQAGGEYQISGLIEKEFDGAVKVHSFVRADKFSSKDDCVATTLAKGRQIIREQGNRLFD